MKTTVQLIDSDREVTTFKLGKEACALLKYLSDNDIINGYDYQIHFLDREPIEFDDED